MPSVSRQQQKLMGAAYARKQAGHPRATDPQMSVGKLREFAATPRRGLPSRARGSYGGGPVASST
jgi:hypothetical protein